MKLSQVKRAYKLFAHPNTEKSTIRHNVKAWLKSVNLLGDKWILASQVQRKGN
jgi:hypothetical protein